VVVTRARGAPATPVALDRLDELYLVLDDRHATWNVHFEVRSASTMDRFMRLHCDVLLGHPR
jgi:hypothetical protein